MAIDPGLKTALNTLIEGQMKLTQGQTALTQGQEQLLARADKVDEQLRRAAALINTLVEGQSRLIERIDAFASLVVRGFTDGAGRDMATEKRVDALEQRVGVLERR